MRMNANEFGKKLGIGVRVAGRIAQQRAQEAAGGAKPGAKATPAQAYAIPGPRTVYEPVPRYPFPSEIREIKEKTHKLTRAAGRGIGGFLRPSAGWAAFCGWK
jgi:hypothetical protein